LYPRRVSGFIAGGLSATSAGADFTGGEEFASAMIVPFFFLSNRRGPSEPETTFGNNFRAAQIAFGQARNRLIIREMSHKYNLLLLKARFWLLVRRLPALITA
jgi:hypothetical protein